MMIRGFNLKIKEGNMQNKRLKIRHLIKESVRTLLNENFYLFDPNEAANPNSDKGWTVYDPLAVKIVNYLADIERLQRYESRMTLPQVVASGAEGIVVSLDDFKVIKLFHSLENAAKNLDLVSGSPDSTARIYDKGVIELSKPVTYWKPRSAHNQRMKNLPIDKLYYIIMERIVPDNRVWMNIENEFISFSRVKETKFSDLLRMYNLDSQVIKSRIEFLYDKIMRDMIQDPDMRFINAYNVSNFDSLIDYINNPDTPAKHIRRITAACNNLFVKYGKINTTDNFIVNNDGSPLTLKLFSLNALGIINTFEGSDELLQLFMSHLSEKRIGNKRSPLNKNETLDQDYKDILALIHKVIVVEGLPWRDIHEEQFGRRKNGQLIALDLGEKDLSLNRDVAGSRFETNISHVDLDLITTVTPAGEQSEIGVDSHDPTHIRPVNFKGTKV